MAEENKYDSGPAVIPIAHPEGGVHDISAPPDTPIQGLHDALMDSGYAHDIPPPTKEGALEYSEQFRMAARNAIGASRNFTGNESGFSSDAQGNPGKIQTTVGVATAGASHQLKIAGPSNAQYTLHTHPKNTGSDQPSPEDVQNAKNLHRTVYVASQAGLFSVDPGGRVTQVFKNPDWAKGKK